MRGFISSLLSSLFLLIPAFALGQVPQPMIPEPADFGLQGEGAETEAAEDEIETDRDSFTPATTTVGRSR